MRALFMQSFPAPPRITEHNCPQLDDKTIIVTGGTSGCGFELVKILYSRGANVYFTARSNEKGETAIQHIKSACPDGTGRLSYFLLEYDDLRKVKQGADAFKSKEKHVDILYHNAGVAAGANGRLSTQNIDIHLAVNCLGPFLLTQYLLPEIQAAKNPRIIWTSSMIVDARPIPGGLCFTELDSPSSDQARNYATSKAGNWFLASEFGHRFASDNIISVVQNPGNLRTPIWKEQSRLMMLMMSPILKPAIYGAHTMLWAGVSQEVTKERNGEFVIPRGQFHPCPREDVLLSLRSTSDGGTGLAARFWDWCQSKCEPYMSM